MERLHWKAVERRTCRHNGRQVLSHLFPKRRHFPAIGAAIWGAICGAISCGIQDHCHRRNMPQLCGRCGYQRHFHSQRPLIPIVPTLRHRNAVAGVETSNRGSSIGTAKNYFGGVYHLFVHSVFCGCHG